MQRDDVTTFGRAIPRKEGREKVTGSRRYVDDLTMPGLIHGVTVRSAIARGEIERIEFGPGIPWQEITVVTAGDIPGKNQVALILYDQPFLADHRISHPEEAVVLLAHPDKHLLEKARAAVRIHAKPLPAALDIDAAAAKAPLIWGDDNVFKAIAIDKGDVDAAMRGAYRIIEGVYHTGAQEQLYIEPNGMIATYDDASGVTVYGSMQCPFYVHKALMPLFGLPADKVRVVQTETGGGFGGKEEYPSMLAGHAALLAYKSRRPVKMIYDRAEDMVATTKRHPSRTRHRTAVDKDGKLLAMDIDFTLDGGAYATLSAVVLSRGAIHAAGPYDCPNVRIRARVLATNHPPQGAFRGFGAPQSVFACERQLDKVAAAVGLTPAELRRRNFLGKGGSTATLQVIREDVDMAGIMRRAFELCGYDAKRDAWTKANAAAGARIKRGIGFATFMHGAGFTGSGERTLASEAGVEVDEGGNVHVLASSTEMGQGTITVFTQIAATTLGLPHEQVVVAQPDTARVPNSGPTVASRTVMVVGKLIESACLTLKQKLIDAKLLGAHFTPAEFRAACRAYRERHGSLPRALAKHEPPADIQWDDATYRGDAYATYAWACYVAEVEVDLVTYEARVVDFTAVQEVGKVVHPVLAAGQIEGGVAQGVGFALYEKVEWREGRMANGRMTNYIIPTAADAPRIEVDFVEGGPTFGPGGGAKGIGELPMDGSAPAVANALEHALGVAVDEIPCLPETLMRLVRSAKR
jgi:CO/xanthine dehydrogenase Mo-binding subunit